MKLIRKGNHLPADAKFYVFRQNNSGGSFDYYDQGISVEVIVEATSLRDSVKRAEMIGLYFDGYGDCPCCGNRWSEPWEDSGLSVEELFNHIGDAMTSQWSCKHMDEGNPEIFVHKMDGSIYGFWLGDQSDEEFLNGGVPRLELE